MAPSFPVKVGYLELSCNVFEGYLELSRGVSEGICSYHVVFTKGIWSVLVGFLKGIRSSHSGVSEDVSSLGLLDPKFIDKVISRNIGYYLSVYTS